MHTGSATNSDLTFSKSLVPVYIAAYESDNFCNELRNEIISQKPQYSNKVSNSALKGMLSFSQDGAVPIFDVKVTSQDKNLALTVAEAVVKLSHSEDPTELPAINSYVPHSSADLELYRTPILPSTPNDKNVARNAVIGFFAAAVVATAGVVVAGLLDVTIRDKKKLESHLDVPVLGVIPRNEVGKVETKKNGNA